LTLNPFFCIFFLPNELLSFIGVIVSDGVSA
jgi:hypothetical protein